MQELDLKITPQFEKGDAIVESATHEAPTRHQLPGMDGSYRVGGGTTAIVERLVQRLPSSSILTGSRVNCITREAGSIKVSIDNYALPVIRPRRLVVAMPLRIAASSIRWSPALDSRVAHFMEATPTWMAAQAKAAAIYSEPFWRAKGLSGRIASRLGPLVESHDHSGELGNPAGLFGFIGWPNQIRHTNADPLQSAIITQLVRCFGEGARTPDHFQVEDWAENSFVCAPTDITEPPQHPQLAPSLLRKPFWDDRVFLAVAETATVSPGLIEGAFHVGSAVAKGVSATLR
jgi:monoamine oxidase